MTYSSASSHTATSSSPGARQSWVHRTRTRTRTHFFFLCWYGGQILDAFGPNPMDRTILGIEMLMQGLDNGRTHFGMNHAGSTRIRRSTAMVGRGGTSDGDGNAIEKRNAGGLDGGIGGKAFHRLDDPFHAIQVMDKATPTLVDDADPFLFFFGYYYYGSWRMGIRTQMRIRRMMAALL